MKGGSSSCLGVGAQRPAGVGQALVDQAVEPAGQGGGVADARALVLDGGEHRDRLDDQVLGGLGDLGAVGGEPERVLEQRLHDRLGVRERHQLGAALGAGGLDEGLVAADARVGAPDRGVDAVALDDVEEVARQPRLGEELVEPGEVGLGGGPGRHRATPG